MMRAGVRAASRATRRSSAARSAQPSEGSASTSSPLPRSMASRSPARSACTASIAVTTPMRGRARAQSARMSPSTYIPISATYRTVPSGRLRSDIGSPISLLAFPGVAAQPADSPPRAAAISCFVVVFPTDPVTPITSSVNRLRHSAAARLRATRPFSTRISEAPDARTASSTSASAC